MTKMRRAVAGLAFAAMLALSLAATQSTAAAATIDPRDGISAAEGRNRPTAPAKAVPPKTGGMLTALGVTWED